ncbi:hypothetical protein V6N13_053381 [Hibiscus sabdariffa]
MLLSTILDTFRPLGFVFCRSGHRRPPWPNLGDHDEAVGTVRKFIRFMWGVVCGQMLKGAVWVGSTVTMGPAGIMVVHKRAAAVGLIFGYWV